MLTGNNSNSHWIAVVGMFAALVFALNVFAQAPSVPGGATAPLSAEELDKLVSPIALYPDDLIAIILPASTNPLQIVQADRFLEKRKNNPQLPVDEEWDDAVKSLLNYPEVVKTMSNDIDWTASLGEAVVADQSATLAAIQAFRRKTQAAGNLKSDDKQVVVVEKEVVKIVPADPQVIYVPQYNPSTVVVSGGYSSFGYYPAPYPVYYYPYAPGAAFATGLVWGAALGAAWNGGRYSTNYEGGTANININRNTTVNANRSSVASNRASSTQWTANKQPGQVRGTAARPSSARVGYSAGTTSAGTTSAGAGRGSAQSASASGRSSDRQSASGSNVASRQSASGSSVASRQSASGSAFSGSSSGYQAQLDSSRGATSRSSMSSGGFSQSRGGAGMGGGGGRGGGGRR